MPDWIKYVPGRRLLQVKGAAVVPVCTSVPKRLHAEWAGSAV